MSFLDAIRGAVSRAVAYAQPPNIAEQVAPPTPRLKAQDTQAARVEAYREWKQQGSKQGFWTRWVGFSKLANRQWIPVHSSNVSAIRWSPTDPNLDSSREALLQEGRIRDNIRPWYQDMIDVGAGHGSQSYNIKSRSVNAGDLSRIKELLTDKEYRAFEQRVMFPTPAPYREPPREKAGLTQAPAVRGRKIDSGTNGVLFVRYHDSRVYLYPGFSLGEAMAGLQAPSAGRWVWESLRWSGRPYQQIAGPRVQRRAGQGH